MLNGTNQDQVKKSKGQLLRAAREAESWAKGVATGLGTGQRNAMKLGLIENESEVTSVAPNHPRTSAWSLPPGHLL